MELLHSGIRALEQSDASAIAVLSGELGYPTTPGNMVQRLDILLDDPMHCAFVAIDDSHIIGWIHGLIAFRIESDPFVEIAGLVVSKHSRSQGVGRALVQAVSNWAVEQNIRTVRVRTNIRRKATHGFYEHLGFQATKVQTVFDLDLMSQ